MKDSMSLRTYSLFVSFSNSLVPVLLKGDFEGDTSRLFTLI